MEAPRHRWRHRRTRFGSRCSTSPSSEGGVASDPGGSVCGSPVTGSVVVALGVEHVEGGVERDRRRWFDAGGEHELRDVGLGDRHQPARRLQRHPNIHPQPDRRGDGGYIVNTASGAGLVHASSGFLYATSKFGVVGLSEALHDELSPVTTSASACCAPDRWRPTSSRTPTTCAPAGDVPSHTVREALARSHEWLAAGTPPNVVGQMVLDAITATHHPHPHRRDGRRHGHATLSTHPRRPAKHPGLLSSLGRRRLPTGETSATHARECIPHTPPTRPLRLSPHAGFLSSKH